MRTMSWLVFVLGLLPFLAQAQPTFELASTQTLLPKTVLPTRVSLALDLDPAKDSFAGEMHMQLRVLQRVPAIVLHADELQADAVELRAAGHAARPLRVHPDRATQTWRLIPADGRPIAAGAWTLGIRYRGRVQRTGEGLYRADYLINGRPARMLGTQLEAVHARRLLPVFDEPVFRCVFALEVRAPSGLQVFSNMPERRSESAGGRIRHHFAPTPAMPSYLLAVTVGRFDVLEDKVDGIPLRILTVPGKREQARLAMEVTRQVVPFYANYFGRGYALPKLDQVAVPGTRQGAMEDWGLISYVEDALLYDPTRSDEGTRRTVFGVTAHEIAHQWFGNLVSAASWEEIWLNEAFATWMQNKAAAHFHPEWQSVLRERRRVDTTMARDATAATRAIRSGPVSEASVFEVFDGVTYDKGGAVLSMLEQWIGEAAFQRGLASYIAERAFKPATAGDLWQHMGRAAGLPAGQVGAVAASWTDQPGLPALAVSQRCEAGQTVVSLRQSRFAQGEALEGGPWRIPLRVSRGGALFQLLMQGPEQSLNLPGCEPLPVLVNAGGRGYLRVDYDPDMAQRLAAGFVALAPADRVTLLSDSQALASAGRRPMTEHLALLRTMPQVEDESRAALFSLGLSQWTTLDTVFVESPAMPVLRARGIALFGPELERLGWQAATGEDSERQALRAELIRRLARFGHGPTLAAAHARFTDALTGAPTVAPSMRAALLYAAGCDATDGEFEAMLSALHRTQSQEERWNLLMALAAGRDPRRAERLLDEALKGSLPQDIASSIPGAVASQAAFVPLAYDFSVSHWEALLHLAGEGSFGARHWLLPEVAQLSSDPAMARRLLLDQQRLDGPAGESAARQISAAIDNAARLRQRELKALASLH